MIEPTKVTLGGVAYELKPLPLRKARALREKITAIIENVSGTLSAMDSVEISLTKMSDIGGLIQSFGGTLAGSVDMLADWLFEFSAEIAADRERILDEAYDDEILRAFGEAIKMLYPFGGVLKSLDGLAGLANSMSSPSPNGESGRMKLTK